jgi:hypothetical protein
LSRRPSALTFAFRRAVLPGLGADDSDLVETVTVEADLITK